MRTVRMGAGSAYWGDMLEPAVELAERGGCDYLGFDHLAELTLAILQRQRAKDPATGYIEDIVPWTQALLPVARPRGTRIITNAGGANPSAAAHQVVEIARAHGLGGTRVGRGVRARRRPGGQRARGAGAAARLAGVLPLLMAAGPGTNGRSSACRGAPDAHDHPGAGERCIRYPQGRAGAGRRGQLRRVQDAVRARAGHRAGATRRLAGRDRRQPVGAQGGSAVPGLLGQGGTLRVAVQRLQHPAAVPGRRPPAS
jgi:hypothetical protein